MDQPTFDEMLQKVIQRSVEAEIDKKLQSNFSKEWLLTIKEFAKICGCSEQQVSKLKVAGRLPVVEISDRLYLIDLWQLVQDSKQNQSVVLHKPVAEKRKVRKLV